MSAYRSAPYRYRTTLSSADIRRTRTANITKDDIWDGLLYGPVRLALGLLVESLLARPHKVSYNVSKLICSTVTFRRCAA